MLTSFAASATDFGKQNYLLRCAGCHLTDGAGSEINGIPDMRHSLGKFLNTADGRAFIVQVPGVASSPLSDQEVVEVMHWMLANFSKAETPAGAAPYTADEVRQLRATVPADIPRTRARVVEGLRATGQDIK